MRTAPFVAVGMAAVLTAACAPGLPVRVNDTPGIASAYATFFVLGGDATSARAEHLTSEIVAALTDRGLLVTAPEEAEAVVVVNTATPARNARQAFYDGWGGWDWRGSGANAVDSTTIYKPGTLVVDVFDAWTKKLIWHAARPRVERSGTRIFRDFPTATDDGLSHRVAASPRPQPPDASMRIIFSSAPAIVVPIDGEPRYERIAGTELQRVTNTAALIIRDESDTHYLRLGATWLEAYELIGPWTRAGMVPEGAEIALTESAAREPGAVAANAYTDGPLPIVNVATTPTALVVTDGEPEYAAYRGTPLLYVKNSDASVFKEPTDKELYVRLPRGWFRAWTTNGPWQSVPDNALPADLARVQQVTAQSSRF